MAEKFSGYAIDASAVLRSAGEERVAKSKKTPENGGILKRLGHGIVGQGALWLSEIFAELSDPPRKI